METNPYIWEINFPPVYIHTSISFLKRCEGFSAAKGGSLEKAKIVVNKCVKNGRINEIKQKYQDAVLLPVIHNNKLPEALAEIIGLETHLLVCKTSNEHRKKMSGLERILHQPKFTGEIVKEKKYVLVDDVVSQGGTVSALRRYVLNNGGQVCAVIALSHALNGGKLAPNDNNIIQLTKKLTNIDSVLKSYFNINDLRELTNQQINYLLRFKETKKIISKINNFLLKRVNSLSS